MSDPVVISSIIVQVRPERMDAVAAEIESLPGYEIFVTDLDGKLIVVLESESDRELSRMVDALTGVASVLSVNLVYHHTEARPDAAA